MTPELPRKPEKKIAGNRLVPPQMRLVRTVLVLLLAFLLVPTVAVSANADSALDRRKAQLEALIRQAKRDIASTTAEVSRAVAEFRQAQGQLQVTRAELDQVRIELDAARKADAELQRRLTRAIADLKTAEAAVAQGQVEVKQQQDRLGQAARNAYTRKTNLLGLAMLSQATSMRDLSSRLQWSTTLINTTDRELRRLQALQVKLAAAEQQQGIITNQVRTDRQTAAETLARIRDLERQAEIKEAQVSEWVKKAADAQRAAEQDLANEKRLIVNLENENTAVERRIQQRIAAQRAAEARAAARARERNRAPSRSSTPPSFDGPSSSGFMFPVKARISSQYGMRVSPISGRWSMHNGTDFAAWCGVPLRAPADGVVSEQYYNWTFGKRLFIDHGKYRGNYITTVMNHAEGYIVKVGQRVRKGQIVGYVGTTGGSTGCHLHLIVYRNGSTINPLSFF